MDHTPQWIELASAPDHNISNAVQLNQDEFIVQFYNAEDEIEDRWYFLSEKTKFDGIHKYNIKTNTWSLLIKFTPSLINSNFVNGAICYNAYTSTLYLTGGSSWLYVINMNDPDTGTSIESYKPITSDDGDSPSTVIIRNKLHVIGGRSSYWHNEWSPIELIVSPSQVF